MKLHVAGTGLVVAGVHVPVHHVPALRAETRDPAGLRLPGVAAVGAVHDDVGNIRRSGRGAYRHAEGGTGEEPVAVTDGARGTPPGRPASTLAAGNPSRRRRSTAH